MNEQKSDCYQMEGDEEYDTRDLEALQLIDKKILNRYYDASNKHQYVKTNKNARIVEGRVLIVCLTSGKEVLTSMGNKGVPGLLAHFGLNPDWSILDNRMSAETCAMGVCSTTSVVANQRVNTPDWVYKETQKVIVSSLHSQEPLH